MTDPPFTPGAGTPPPGEAENQAATQAAIEAALWRLRGHFHKTVDLGFDRLLRLLGDLGNPHEALPPVVHIAGTNGKGSTLAFLRTMTRAAGLRVHSYTSPHLSRFNERIQLDGAPIADETLLALLEEVEAVNAGGEITYFEAATAAAFLAFARHPADLLLLEVGLGGRLDATNVVAGKILTVITRISRDHVEQLGDTIPQIAGEKAGILRPRVPLILAAKDPAAVSTIQDKATALDVPVKALGDPYDGFIAEPTADGFRYREGEYDLVCPPPALAGAHQIDNAGTAMAAARALRRQGYRIGERALYRGLVEVDWPGRLQDITDSAWATGLPAGSTLLVDGGHNDSAGEALAAHFAAQRDSRPLWLITARLRTKVPRAFLSPLAPHVERAWIVPVAADQPFQMVAEGVAEAEGLGLRADPAESVTRALEAINAAARASGDAGKGAGPVRVLIAGSLYLAGDVLRAAGS